MMNNLFKFISSSLFDRFLKTIISDWYSYFFALNMQRIITNFSVGLGFFLLFQVFRSQEQLMEWAQSTSIPLGYVLVKGRSNKNSAGYTIRVLLMCDRGGVPRDRGSTGARAAFSKKCNCPFKLQGYFDSPYGWRVNVKEHRHNHLPLENLVGHAYARRLSVDERKWVELAAQMNNPPREIFAKLKENFPNNLSTVKDIYNLVEKIRADAAERVGNTPMQVMLSVLLVNGRTFEFRVIEITLKFNFFSSNVGSFVRVTCKSLHLSVYHRC